MLDFLRVLPQYLLPRHYATALVYKITRIKTPFIKNQLIKIFIYIFNVDMSASETQSIEDFQHFNDFFTRQLKTNARPINSSVLVSPVDGFISEIGKLKEGSIIQAKNRNYTVNSLLGQHYSEQALNNGIFTTLYLSPSNYHRIHMPINGSIEQMTYIPGDLFAVNQHTVRQVDNLFSRNERVVLEILTAYGSMYLVMVGAIFVGSMETVWAGQITPAKNRVITNNRYQEKELVFTKGDEIARFNMGSTVILILPETFTAKNLSWQSKLHKDQAIQMGQSLIQAD